MTQRQFSVSEQVFEHFPDYVVGWVSASVDQSAADGAAIIALLRAAEARVQVMHSGKDLKEVPAIAAWRGAFSTMGWSASKYPSSVEALVKRVARGGELPSINPAVDLVNAVSLTYTVPAGCHDLDKKMRLEVRPAQSGDIFAPMGNAEEEAPDTGEIVYVSDSDVRTRRWVWRQSRNALVTSASTWIFIPVDGFEDVSGSNVEAAVSFLSTAFGDYFGAATESGWVDRDRPSAYISNLQIDQ